MSMGELSYSSLKTASQAKEADEVRTEARKKHLLLLMYQYLSDDGYFETANMLARETNLDMNKHRVCDNIDLHTILMEYEAYYFVRFAKYPKLTKKISEVDDPRLMNRGPNDRNSSKALPKLNRVVENGNQVTSPVNSDGGASSVTSGVAGRPNQNRQSLSKQPSTKKASRKDDAGENVADGQGGQRGAAGTTGQSSNGPADLVIQGSNKPQEVFARAGGSRENDRPAIVPADSGLSANERLLRPLGAVRFSGEIKELAEMISRDIYLENPNVRWDDIIGLDAPKRLIKEAVVYPIRYPQLFSGILSPWKGLLLYGPPGTGKTLLAKAVATECGTTFFNISASTIVSKWRGDSEKLVRVLFELARFHAPSTIFLDEIDSIMSHRGSVGGSTDHEASRRMKTELLIQMDGLAKTDDLVFLLAASNLPWELDHALLRRLEKRILVGLPTAEGRAAMFTHFLPPLTVQASGLRLAAQLDYGLLANRTDGYSGSDIRLVCKEAAMNSIRKVFDMLELPEMQNERRRIELDPIRSDDVLAAIQRTKPSATRNTFQKYTDFEREFQSV